MELASLFLFSFFKDICFIYMTNVIPFLSMLPSENPLSHHSHPSQLHSPQFPGLHSPIVGNWAFTRPMASPLIDVWNGHLLLHMYLEPWVPSCVLFGWWFSPWELWRVLVGTYYCSSCMAANLFSSFGPFTSCSTRNPMLILLFGCQPCYLDPLFNKDQSIHALVLLLLELHVVYKLYLGYS